MGNENDLAVIGQRARSARRALATLLATEKNDILYALADALEDPSHQEPQLACQDDVIDEIPVNQGLGEAEQGGGKDQNGPQNPFSPVGPDKGAEDFQVGSDRSAFIFLPQPVGRKFSGKPPL